MGAEDIRDEKVKVLRSMQTVRLEDMVLGQYRGRSVKGMSQPGYLDDPTVPPDRCAAAGGRGRRLGAGGLGPSAEQRGLGALRKPLNTCCHAQAHFPHPGPSTKPNILTHRTG